MTVNVTLNVTLNNGVQMPALGFGVFQTRFDLTQEAYSALETLLADGRVRAIGVSNFMPGHLDALLKQATAVPAVNQVEVHPYFTQPGVLAADAARGILTQAWSPIGGITSHRGTGTSTAYARPIPET